MTKMYKYPKIINNISITKLQKSCPMYSLYIYCIFKSTKLLPYFAASNQHFSGMPEYVKHMILNNLQVFDIYNNKNDKVHSKLPQHQMTRNTEYVKHRNTYLKNVRN